jgi:HD-GYP domain-containing protein (c-di-GMP phosphodiesterase class II)
MEARDPHTEHHSQRVAAMTECLCILLGLPGQVQSHYHIAAHLHDVGKIGISDAVLFKKGTLTQAEWGHMRNHPVIGYEILCPIDCFKEIATIVLHHHERYDGNGYPDGIAAKDIPLCSRIIAIADSTDAMLSNRSYRSAISEEQCRGELFAGKGTMYDPALVDLALEHWREFMQARKTADGVRGPAQCYRLRS